MNQRNRDGSAVFVREPGNLDTWKGVSKMGSAVNVEHLKRRLRLKKSESRFFSDIHSYANWLLAWRAAGRPDRGPVRESLECSVEALRKDLAPPRFDYVVDKVADLVSEGEVEAKNHVVQS